MKVEENFRFFQAENTHVVKDSLEELLYSMEQSVAQTDVALAIFERKLETAQNNAIIKRRQKTQEKMSDSNLLVAKIQKTEERENGHADLKDRLIAAMKRKHVASVPKAQLKCSNTNKENKRNTEVTCTESPKTDDLCAVVPVAKDAKRTREQHSLPSAKQPQHIKSDDSTFKSNKMNRTLPTGAQAGKILQSPIQKLSGYSVNKEEGKTNAKFDGINAFTWRFVNMFRKDQNKRSDDTEKTGFTHLKYETSHTNKSFGCETLAQRFRNTQGDFRVQRSSDSRRIERAKSRATEDINPRKQTGSISLYIRKIMRKLEF